MVTAIEPEKSVRLLKLSAWLPLAILPVTVVLLWESWPAWALMWLLAGSIFFGLKWLTFADSPLAREAPLGRSLAYLLLWPGMNATNFLSLDKRDQRPYPSEWWSVGIKVILGLLLVYAVAPLMVEHSPLIAGWLGLAGIVLILHFGFFHLLSVVWRHNGIDAPPIMQAPLLSTSLTEFWGKRWNLAFRDVSHAYIFRPLLQKFGAGGAILSVFLVSGLIHDLVISIPAGAGYGLPTLYFIIHGTGLFIEKSHTGKRLGLGRGIRGWLFCAAITLVPVFLLFHQPFIERVVLPMLRALGAL